MSNNFKETGIVWCPRIPQNWIIGRVKQYFNISKEKAHDNNPVILKLARAGVQVRDISTNEGQIAESYENYNPVCPGDLLLNPMDLYSGANCNVSNLFGVISPAYVNLRSKGDINSRYCDYYFKVQYWTMAMFAHGKGVSFENRWTINTEGICNYEIPIPPIQTQNAIVCAIEESANKIDELIIVVQQQISKLREYRHSIITEAVTKGLDPSVKFQYSGIEWLGDIPEKWSVISVGAAFNFIGGYAYQSARFTSETEHQVLRIGNVKNDRLIIDDKCVYIDAEYADESRKCKVQENDILFTMTGTKGKKDYFYTALVNSKHISEKNLYINQRVGCFRRKSALVNMGYMNYLLKVDRVRDYIFLFETGTANQGNLGIETIKRTRLLLPPIITQEEIAAYLDKKCAQIDQLIAVKEEKIEKLEQYKKSLIYEYVTGKKEVS